MNINRIQLNLGRHKTANIYLIYLLKVNDRNTRKKCEICLKLTTKTLEQCRWRHSGVFIVNFEHISRLFLVFIDRSTENFTWIEFYMEILRFGLSFSRRNQTKLLSSSDYINVPSFSFVHSSFNKSFPFLFPLKSSENYWFCDFVRGYDRGALPWNRFNDLCVPYGFTTIYHQFYHNTENSQLHLP